MITFQLKKRLWITSDMRSRKLLKRFFIFYELHKSHKGEDGVTLGITFFCSIASPCISQVYCSGVISSASLLVRGHWNRPASRRLYNRRNPSSSHNRPLIRSERLPQNRKRIPGVNGSSLKCSFTIPASPSIPKRRSV